MTRHKATIAKMLATANAVAKARPPVPDYELIADMSAMRLGWALYDENGALIGISYAVPAKMGALLPRPPGGGWERIAALELIDPESDEVFTFRAQGAGVRAIKALCGVYGPHMRVQPDELPIVRLIHIGGAPAFELCGWQQTASE
jgi:hypothetical protein